jgi:hypothetical protein
MTCLEEAAAMFAAGQNNAALATASQLSLRSASDTRHMAPTWLKGLWMIPLTNSAHH